jgi:hypothetical protein
MIAGQKKDRTPRFVLEPHRVRFIGIKQRHRIPTKNCTTGLPGA